MTKHLLKIAVVLACVLLVELFIILIWKDTEKNTFKKEYETRLKLLQLNHEKAKLNVLEKFKGEEYLASGKNVYERIYNTQGQSIVDLIQALAREAFPEEWRTEVKVEEFTNFLLLVQVGTDIKNPNPVMVSKYIEPILPYASPYLSNIAVFDRTHKCIFFFDDYILDKLQRKHTLTNRTISTIQRQGKQFTRYNSITIRCEKIANHFFVPVRVYGEYGVAESVMMLDTGASTSVISLELARQTGSENFNLLPSKTFQTANGVMTCPLVQRRIGVGDIEKNLTVAVNSKDDTNLLGMNFFEDMNYTIDSTSECVYVWKE